MRIQFELTLDGYDISESMDVPYEHGSKELEECYRNWAREQFIKKTGGAEGFEFHLSNPVVTIANE